MARKRLEDGEYVRIFVDGEKVRAHRWVYEQINGPIPRDEQQRGPDDQVVMHTCDNKACVRPSHLIRLGTQGDNIRDAVAKGRMVPYRGGDGRQKLSDFDVANIRVLKAQGAVQHHIAVAFGVSDATISLIVNNRKRRLGV